MQLAVAGPEASQPRPYFCTFFFPCTLSSEANLWASGSLGSLCRPFPEVFTVVSESQVPVSICQIKRF